MTVKTNPSYIWYVNLSAKYQMDGMECRRSIRVAVVASSIESAAACVRKQFPECEIWQVNHGGNLLIEGQEEFK